MFGAGAITIGSSFTAIAGAAIVPATASAIINTGKVYVLYDDFGKLCLKPYESLLLPLYIDEDTAQVTLPPFALGQPLAWHVAVMVAPFAVYVQLC